ncbi:response regulator [bacterium]|nr:response regulator [bacterium]
MTKVLIVDDIEQNLYLLRTLLEGHGYEVISAINGAEALETARRDPPNLIISDILMPVMDGFTLCREWRKAEALKDISFIFYTATYTDERDEQLALQMGADKYIRKPAELDEFMKIIQDVMKNYEKGKAKPRLPVLVKEKEVLELYSKSLVRKLEKKMLDLEKEIAEHKRAREIVEHLNLMLRAIHNVNQLVITENDRERLIKGACEILTGIRSHYNAWIALLDESGKLEMAAESGLGDDFQPMLEMLKRGDLTICGRKAMAQPGVIVIENRLSSCDACPMANKCGDNAALIVRLEAEGKIHGLLSVSIPGHIAVDKEEQVLFKEVADDIAFALYHIELERERMRVEEARERLLHDTNERVKELRCMYGVTESILKCETMEEVFADVAALIPPGWHYPEITRCKVRFESTDYVSEPFEESEWKQAADIVVSGEVCGTVEAYYLEERPELDEGPFLKEERNFIKSIAEQLGLAIERKRAEQEKEQLEEQLRQAQKMEAIGRLAGGVAHDFNNMLSIILGYGQNLLDQLHREDPLLEQAEEIVKAGRRSEALTRQLLAFGRRQTLQPEVLNLNTILKNLDKMLRQLIGEDIIIDMALAEDLVCVEVDPGQIEQIIMNLTINARDAMPKGGKLVIETANVELDDLYVNSHVSVMPGKYVMIAISDTGDGMDKETLSQIFDPFFTTKEMGKGTGLGLSTVYGIVKQSRGNIWVYSESGQGTTFKIYLPQTDAKPETKAKRVAKKEPLGGGKHILVVEDEPALRGLLETILPMQDYQVTVAANGGEALLLIEEKGLKPDLVITDVVMPGMSGPVLVERFRTNQPDLKVLYMSGYTDNAIVHHGVLDPGTPFIQKPFNIRDIAAKIRDVLLGRAG